MYTPDEQPELVFPEIAPHSVVEDAVVNSVFVVLAVEVPEFAATIVNPEILYPAPGVKVMLLLLPPNFT